MLVSEKAAGGSQSKRDLSVDHMTVSPHQSWPNNSSGTFSPELKTGSPLSFLLMVDETHMTMLKTCD
jgi:hypothetical protein